jgi:hypothetical protein
MKGKEGNTMKRYLTMIAAAAFMLAAGNAFAGEGHGDDDSQAKAGSSHQQTANWSGPRLIMPMMNSNRGQIGRASCRERVWLKV